MIGLTAVHFVVALIASSAFGDVARDGFWNNAGRRDGGLHP
ncbi:hypothetical protein [Streptomyces sp. ISL-10]|nr:hypothetical protein [Streptomyces sp. ISL-10]